MDEQQNTDERIEKLEKELAYVSKHLLDLVEYLERTEVIVDMDPASFKTWPDLLADMRRQEKIEKEIKHAKDFLNRHGYIVAKNRNEIDLETLKRWMDSKDESDG